MGMMSTNSVAAVRGLALAVSPRPRRSTHLFRRGVAGSGLVTVAKSVYEMAIRRGQSQANE